MGNYWRFLTITDRGPGYKPVSREEAIEIVKNQGMVFCFPMEGTTGRTVYEDARNVAISEKYVGGRIPIWSQVSDVLEERNEEVKENIRHLDLQLRLILKEFESFINVLKESPSKHFLGCDGTDQVKYHLNKATDCFKLMKDEIQGRLSPTDEKQVKEKVVEILQKMEKNDDGMLSERDDVWEGCGDARTEILIKGVCGSW